MKRDGIPREEIVRHIKFLMARGSDDEFADFARFAAGRFPEDGYVRFLHAVALFPLSREDSHRTALQAVELAPRDGSVLFRAADLMSDLGDDAQARDLARRATELAPTDFVHQAELNELRERLGLPPGRLLS